LEEATLEDATLRGALEEATLEDATLRGTLEEAFGFGAAFLSQ
jgi:uncharacterized protein YjbI with pentapeptide repeats